MAGRDVYRFINDQNEATLQNLIKRLEFRGKDPTFLKMRDAYFAKLPLSAGRSVLDLGCGTGVEGRALANREEFSGRITGVDISETLVGMANGFAAEEGVGHRIKFHVGDVHALD